ncbi:Hypothetical_protein [Hexamita inflata]|uniref:Hypothetical_protein n=1 Tax=Hexamita inflata TaxID=28002 RepID=A0AA86RUE3_9EUKA|nr:Hypothetical protein HINF_LOCUS60400 [Hexamita inflata]
MNSIVYLQIEQYKRSSIFAQRPISVFSSTLCNHGKNNNPLTKEETALLPARPVQHNFAGGKRLSIQVLQPGERTLFQCAETESKAQKKKNKLSGDFHQITTAAPSFMQKKA